MSKKYVDKELGIFCVNNFLSDEECDELISLSENKKYEEASIITHMGLEIAKDVRNNDRVIYDDLELAKKLYERIVEYIPKEIDSWSRNGLNERFRFYKYSPGQYFKWHVDGAFKRDYFEVSKLTVLLYLNSDCEGGETEFETCKVKPEKGMLVVFPHKLRHQSTPIVSGLKYAIRSDVMYAKL
ncbi:prolyl hydroxylase family protein [Methylomonas methanica]|uniref:prolyl hydroxylase family protein n=1 Tax=Methylomonas methanica TaxID=421 RepID=UPI0019309893|nr:2OG-Fe(II) oxygenase [Methylomonas methanica]